MLRVFLGRLFLETAPLFFFKVLPFQSVFSDDFLVRTLVDRSGCSGEPWFCLA